MDRTVTDRRVAAVGLGVLLTFVALAGCGGGTNFDPETTVRPDTTKLMLLVSGVTEAMDAGESERGGRFASLFVEGSVPPAAKQAQYGAPKAFALETADAVEVSGDTATLTVSVFTVSDTGERQAAGTTKWTAVKEGDGWLLKDVPLP